MEDGGDWCSWCSWRICCSFCILCFRVCTRRCMLSLLSNIDECFDQKKKTCAHCCGVLVVYTNTYSVFCPDFKLVFIPILEPGQGFQDKSPRGFCPGWQNR